MNDQPTEYEVVEAKVIPPPKESASAEWAREGATANKAKMQGVRRERINMATLPERDASSIFVNLDS